MMLAVMMWVYAPRSADAWIVALCLWLLGCVFVSAAGLAVLQGVSNRAGQEEPAPAKAKTAAA
jgi:hypothetical protein